MSTSKNTIMVLEYLYPDVLIERRFRYAFFLGLFYSIIGIILAKVLFPANSGIVSVIFVAILLAPVMRKIFATEEQREETQQFSFRKLYTLHYDLFLMYFLIFIAIFLSYLMFAFFLPQFGVNTFDLLKEQLFLDPSLRGKASFSFATFEAIFINNWWVLLATFILSLILGDGAIFFITWNASAWGSIMGFRALSAATYSGENPWSTLIIMLFFVIWHLILEGGAYILAGIAGSIISQKIVKSSVEIREFIVWLVIGSVVFLLFKFIVSVLGLGSLGSFLIFFILTLVLIYFLGKIIAESGDDRVYKYTKAVFAIAIAVFVVGGLVETLVLSNSQQLTNIYTLAFCSPNEIPLEECLEFLRYLK